MHRPLRLIALVPLLLSTLTLAQSPSAPQMDADSIAYMKLQPASSGAAPTPEMLKEASRRRRLKTQPDLPQVYEIREHQAPGPLGPIPIRAYRGANTPATGAQPTLVFYHGGGWMIGNLDSHDWICRMIANKSDCVVISVDYRLVPEFTFPAAYDDALAATKWTVANAGLLRIDPARVAVGGDSAGGNLATAVALALRDEGKIKLRAQILIYPAVDLTLQGNYYGRFTKDLILTDDSMKMFINAYVPNAAQRKDWRASPLLAPSLQGLPPTLVILAGFDPLTAQGDEFAGRLQKEGVSTTVKRWPGQMHGFMSNARLLPKAYEAIDEIAAALKSGFPVN